MNEIRVCPLADVPEGSFRIFEVDDREIGLTRWRDRVYAVSNVCAHQRGPLCRGLVLPAVDASRSGEMELDAHEPVAVCPWHGWEFRVGSGHSVSDPRYRVRVWPARAEGGNVVVELDD